MAVIEPRLALKNGWEQDVVYCRRMYCYLANRPKNVKLIKAKINRRERRHAREVIYRGLVND